MLINLSNFLVNAIILNSAWLVAGIFHFSNHNDMQKSVGISVARLRDKSPIPRFLKVGWLQKILQIARRFFAIFPRFQKRVKNRRFSRDFYVKTWLPPQFLTLWKNGTILGFICKFYLKKKLANFGQELAKSPRFLMKCV